MLRIIKSYTIKHPVSLELYRYEFNGKIALSLNFIQCSNAAEHTLIGDEDGDLTPYDADVSFEDGGVMISGSDGPSGGLHGVRITVPQHLITHIAFENEPGFVEHSMEDT